jgi:hypothetical protein
MSRRVSISFAMLIVLGSLRARAVDDIFVDALDEMQDPVFVKSLLVLPLQSVWQTADRAVTQQTWEQLASLFAEASNIKLLIPDHRPGIAKHANSGQRLRGRWLKEVTYIEALVRAGKFGNVENGSKPVLSQMRRNPSYVTDQNMYCRIQQMLGVVALARGRKRKARKAAETLVDRCVPNSLAGTRVRPIFGFDKYIAAGVAARADRGEARLEVRSDLPGVAVFLDGRPVGTAPLLLEGVAPGKHALVLRREGFLPWSQKFSVIDGQIKRFEANLYRMKRPKDLPEALTALRANRLEQSAVEVAAALLREHDDVPLALVGGVAQDGDKVYLALALVDRQGRAKRLKPMRFSSEFLTAHITLSSLIEKIRKHEAGIPGGQFSAGPLIPILKMPEHPLKKVRWNRWHEGEAGAAPDASEPKPEVAGASLQPVRRKPNDPPKERRPRVPEVLNEEPSEAELHARRKAAHERAERLIAEAKKKLASGTAAAPEAVDPKVPEKRSEAWSKLRKAWQGVRVDHQFGVQFDRVMKQNQGATSGFFGGFALTGLQRRPIGFIPGMRLAFGVEVGIGRPSGALGDETEWGPLEFPFLARSQEEDVAERIRFEHNQTVFAQGVLRLDQHVIGTPLHVLLEWGGGGQMSQGHLLHEQYLLDAAGDARDGTAIEISASDLFAWSGTRSFYGLALRFHQRAFAVGVGYRWSTVTMGEVSSVGQVLRSDYQRQGVTIDLGYRL